MDTAPDDLPGRLLDGRYRVGRVIARGGMSTVFRGIDLRLDRPVAIKVMGRDYVTDPTFRARFEREARITAGLAHPNVVAVYDQGTDGPIVFLIMELVDGGTLRDVLRAGPLPVPMVVSVLEPMLAALGAAHAAGLVHRDVKPENVLISAHGEVKVADFGLVRALSSQTLATGDVILGTVAYLSPEQVERGIADKRSDVYSAGIVGFEMLTGTPPFTGDNPISVAFQHVHADVPAVTDSAPGVPLELDELLLAATRRDPDRRPRDASAFLTALQAVRFRTGMPAVPVLLPRPEPVLSGASGSGRTAVAHPAPAEPGRADGSTAVPHGPGGTAMMAVGGPAATDRTGTAGAPEMGAPTAVRTAAVRTVAGGRIQQETARVEARRRRRVRRWIIAILVILLLGAAAAVSGWWLGSGRWAYAPSAVGSTRQAAEDMVRKAGLVPAVTTAPDNSVGAGTVADSDPRAGTRALRGSVVHLVVSTGRPVVPRIAVGAVRSVAAVQVSDAHLTPAYDPTRDRYDDRVVAGRILDTEPAAGARLPIGARVTLVLSKGPAPRPVPAVSGKSVEDARNALLASGFTVAAEQHRFAADSPDGTVIGTQPGVGTSAPKGSPVALVLAKSITVPSVRGQSTADATDLLTKAGFTVTVGAAAFDADIDGGTVTGSTPAEGTRVDPASPAVTIVPSNAVTVPALKGMDRADAEQALTDLGLTAAVGSYFGGSGGQVIEQDPDPGTRVEPGSTVAFTTFW